jgi:Na+-translocating ferredoxin:NAD+ oxidoreductase RnfD subunit
VAQIIKKGIKPVSFTKQSFSSVSTSIVIAATKPSKMPFKVLIVLSAFVAVTLATVSGDYGSVGVQTDQTIRVRFSSHLNFFDFSMIKICLFRVL